MKNESKTFIETLIDRPLTEEEKNFETIENEYIKTLKKEHNPKTIKDLLELTTIAHNNAIVYLIGEIQLIILKYNLEKEYGELTEDEVLDYAEKQKISKLMAPFRKFDIDLPWEEKGKIYQSINKIILLEDMSNYKALQTPQEIALLEELKRYDFTQLSYKYSCIENLKHRRKLKNDGIESHIKLELDLYKSKDEKNKELENELNAWLNRDKEVTQLYEESTNSQNNPQKIRK